LNISRNDIETYIKKNNLPFIEDSTNKKNIYKRNILRNTVIPVLPEIQPNYEKTFSNLFSYLDEEKKLLKLVIRKYFKKILIYHSDDFICINKKLFSKMIPALKKNLIKYILIKLDYPAKPDKILFKELISDKTRIIYYKKNLFAGDGGSFFWFINTLNVKNNKINLLIDKLPFYFCDEHFEIRLEECGSGRLSENFTFKYSADLFPLIFRSLEIEDRLKTTSEIRIIKILKNMKVPKILFTEVYVLESKDKKIIGFCLKNIFRISKDFYVREEKNSSAVLISKSF
jgi:hypothetical protein